MPFVQLSLGVPLMFFGVTRTSAFVVDNGALHWPAAYAFCRSNFSPKPCSAEFALLLALCLPYLLLLYTVHNLAASG